MSYTFEVTLASQPLPDTKSRTGGDVYPAHVSLDGTVIITTFATDPGGPNAPEEMRHEVMRNFALILHEMVAAHEHIDMHP